MDYFSRTLTQRTGPGNDPSMSHKGTQKKMWNSAFSRHL